MFDNKEETFMQTVYILGEVTYVPHYRNPSVFVGPGYPVFNKTRYSEEQLVYAGAKRNGFPLWKRGTHGIVTDQKP
jgi:hypothetical protein